MRRPSLRWKSFETRVARRVLVLFLLCAALPLTTFAAIGYFQVRGQLTRLAWDRLSTASETAAMSIVERLLLLEADLPRDRETIAEGVPLVLGEGGLWLSRGRVTDTGPRPERLPIVVNPDQRAVLDDGGTVIVVRPSTGGSVVVLRGAGDGGAVWWGTVNPGYLESVAQSLPDQAELCVTSGTQSLVGCAEPPPLDMSRALPRSQTSEPITWSASSGSRLGVQRELFLASEFKSPNWRVLVSEPRAAGLAPIRSFTRTLALVALLCALMVALASDLHLNRMLGPLARLREGTERLSAGDLNVRVEVSTGDEFEELARSFNEMVGRVGDLLGRLEALNVGTIRALASAIDAKSRWTAGHSERVTEVSLRIGAALGLDDEELDILERGAILHDVGKIGVSTAVLDKPGPLDEKEWRAMRAHPMHGVKIVEPIGAYASLLPIIGQHHERWDGSGYPAGLEGEQIDCKARIVAVADAYNAMTSDRPYRKGLSEAKALSIIREESGAAFDPEVVQAFLALHGAEAEGGGLAVVVLGGAPDPAIRGEVRKMA